MAPPPDVHLIDLEYLGVPQTIGSYLLTAPLTGEPVLIEAGPGSTYPALVQGLRARGFAASDVRHVLVTHIHLDHAGAAGHLAAEGAQVYVHAFGAPHLVDPSKLLDSATRIYGDQMDRLWGRMIPVPEDRVTAIDDGDVIEVGGLRLTTLYTPGHARHHCSFMLDLDRRRVCFAGDAAGMVVPVQERTGNGASSTAVLGGAHHPFINLPTPPPEFDLDLWFKSAARLEAFRFRSLYLTHFGEVRTPDSHLVAVRRSLRAHAEFVRSGLRAGRSEEAILEQYRPWVMRQAGAAGVTGPEQRSHFISDNLLRMNVSGLARYWRQREPGLSR